MDVFEKCAEIIKAQKEIYYNAFEDGKASAGADKVQEVLKRKDAEVAERYKQQEAELEELRIQKNKEVNENADTE